MSPAEAAIREALAAGPTDGPWEFRTFEDHDGPPCCDDLYVCGIVGNVDAALLTMDWREHRDDMTPRAAAEQNARHIAACNPTAIRSLLSELDALRARCEAADALLREAEQFVVSYANRNPMWTDNFSGNTRDPNGVHALRDRIDAHLKGPTT